MSRLLCISILSIICIANVARSQTCSTGTVDERVAVFLKSLPPDATLAQLKGMSISQLKNDGPKQFKRLSEDSVKRIKITSEKIKVNVVNVTGKKGLPVIINYHGGGFIMPLLPWMEYDAMKLSKKFNAVVFDVDYRVAPENKFPAAPNDAYNSFLWISEHAAEYGGDPSKIILNGVSSGANLVALVANRAKKESKITPVKLLIMNCPPTDNPMTSFYASYEDNAYGYMLTKDMAIFYLQTYLDKADWFRPNPEMWPMQEKDLKGLPPALILTAEFDILRDEGIAYGKKLEQAGNMVAIKCFPHQIHTFVGLPENSGEINRVYELMGEAIASALK